MFYFFNPLLEETLSFSIVLLQVLKVRQEAVHLLLFGCQRLEAATRLTFLEVDPGGILRQLLPELVEARLLHEIKNFASKIANSPRGGTGTFRSFALATDLENVLTENLHKFSLPDRQEIQVILSYRLHLETGLYEAVLQLRP